jgi:hypothetical protein
LGIGWLSNAERQKERKRRYCVAEKLSDFHEVPFKQWLEGARGFEPSIYAVPDCFTERSLQ